MIAEDENSFHSQMISRSIYMARTSLPSQRCLSKRGVRMYLMNRYAIPIMHAGDFYSGRVLKTSSEVNARHFGSSSSPHMSTPPISGKYKFPNLILYVTCDRLRCNEFIGDKATFPHFLPSSAHSLLLIVTTAAYTHRVSLPQHCGRLLG